MLWHGKYWFCQSKTRVLKKDWGSGGRVGEGGRRVFHQGTLGPRIQPSFFSFEHVSVAPTPGLLTWLLHWGLSSTHWQMGAALLHAWRWDLGPTRLLTATPMPPLGVAVYVFFSTVCHGSRRTSSHWLNISNQQKLNKTNKQKLLSNTQSMSS